MKSILYITVIMLFAAACKKDSTNITDTDENYSGYVYTSTNSSTGNAVIALGRKSDGTMKELPNSPYSTSANGDAADGDFDTQWSIRIVGDYLLAVNAGGNPTNGSISVFKINRTNGSLTQVDQNTSTAAIDNMDSRGIRATSIAAKDVGGSTWIVVGNQHSNPNFQMPAGMAVGSIASSALRNLAVFNFNKTTGILEYKSIGATYMDGNNGGPTTVEFNSTGSKIAVSTWGVPHFMTPDADLTKQKPGRLYIYNFSGGSLAQTGMFEEAGVSGNIGFSWSPNDQYIYLTNFNLHSSKEANSVTVHDGATAAKVQNLASGGRNDEACWSWVSFDKTKLFAASFGENIVSVYNIDADNKLTTSLTPNFFARSGGLPMGDTKDMHESADGYLNVVGAYQSHTITTFRIASNGSLSEVAGSPYSIPSSAGKTKDQHAFLGLTGFDK
jgi:6-phosphogluconolactonase (cycloisomerase 2 family)